MTGCGSQRGLGVYGARRINEEPTGVGGDLLDSCDQSACDVALRLSDRAQRSFCRSLAALGRVSLSRIDEPICRLFLLEYGACNGWPGPREPDAIAANLCYISVCCVGEWRAG